MMFQLKRKTYGEKYMLVLGITVKCVNVGFARRQRQREHGNCF